MGDSTSARFDVAILPWGATEAHNHHLPYGTDVIESDAVAAESARRAWERGTKVVVLPCVPFGVNTGQLDIPLCINMNPSTQAAVLADVTAVLDTHAIGKLVILNGHGGNDFRQMIRELQPKVRLFLCTINWYTCLDPRPFFNEPGDHAGEPAVLTTSASSPCAMVRDGDQLYFSASSAVHRLSLGVRF